MLNLVYAEYLLLWHNGSMTTTISTRLIILGLSAGLLGLTACSQDNDAHSANGQEESAVEHVDALTEEANPATENPLIVQEAPQPLGELNTPNVYPEIDPVFPVGTEVEITADLGQGLGGTPAVISGNYVWLPEDGYTPQQSLYTLTYTVDGQEYKDYGWFGESDFAVK